MTPSLFLMAPHTPLFASEGHFGLNLNLFETNVINLAIVIAALVWFLPKVLGSALEKRREAILSDLHDAEERLGAATTALATAQKDLAEAQIKADQIRADGKVRAESIRLESERRTVEAMALLKQGSSNDLQSEADRVSEKLRREAARLAVEKALAALPSKLDAGAQLALIDRSIESLGEV